MLAVVTDIENSTVAWEMLELEIMDSCINSHNECVRSVMRIHHGFESATEGGKDRHGECVFSIRHTWYPTCLHEGRVASPRSAQLKECGQHTHVEASFSQTRKQSWLAPVLASSFAQHTFCTRLMPSTSCVGALWL